VPRFKTLAIDSGSELARLAFAWDMKKHAGDYETIRAVNNYPGSSERMNMIARRCKDIVDSGVEVVIICHEGIDKVYAKGGGLVRKKGEEDVPAAIKGRIDIPGQAAPEEIMRAAGNVFRVRMVNGKPAWIANPEAIPGSDGAMWQVKDKFFAQKISGGLLPASYKDIAQKAIELKLNWKPPYFWIIYGAVGFHKTRSLLTFPRPIKILDVDRGTEVIENELDLSDSPTSDMLIRFNAEECDDYPRFMLAFEQTLSDPTALSRMKKQLGIKEN
jgi:hypothetical protein